MSSTRCITPTRNYHAARENFLSTGEMRVDGDPSQMGGWLDAVHDPIVDLTN